MTFIRHFVIFLMTFSLNYGTLCIHRNLSKGKTQFFLRAKSYPTDKLTWVFSISYYCKQYCNKQGYAHVFPNQCFDILEIDARVHLMFYPHLKSYMLLERNCILLTKWQVPLFNCLWLFWIILDFSLRPHH